MTLINVCSLTEDAPEHNLNDVFLEIKLRMTCRCAILACLAVEFHSTAIPDHNSLDKYAALLRSAFSAMLRDLKTIRFLNNANTSLFFPTDMQIDLISLLHCSIQQLIGVDHRPAVASESTEETVLVNVLHSIEYAGFSTSSSDLLMCLIRLHHELRL